MFHLLSLSQAIERCHFWLGAYFDLTPSWVTPAFFPETNYLISASHSQNRWFLSPDIYFHWKSLVFKQNDLTSPEYYSPLSDLLTHCVNTSPRPHPFPTRTVWVSGTGILKKVTSQLWRATARCKCSETCVLGPSSGTVSMQRGCPCPHFYMFLSWCRTLKGSWSPSAHRLSS